MFLLVVATPAGASLLHLEGVLDSQAALPAAQRRLEFGSTYYGAAKWTGLRHLIRLAGARGEQVQWSLTLPWLYSSYGNGGRSGRDNLHLGGAFRLMGSEPPRLRLGGEFWVPLAGGELAPLGERRAFGRLALLGELAGGGLETGLSYTWELRGIGPETNGGPWPDAWSLDLRLGRRPAAGARACFLGGGTWQPEGDLAYAWLGAGLDLAWGEAWLVDVAGAAYFGAGDDPTRADYRLRLGLRRDVKLAAIAPPAPADAAPAGEAPPPGEPPVSAP